MQDSSFVLDAWQINGKKSQNIQQDAFAELEQVWLHCDRTSQSLRTWLLSQNYDDAIVESLLANDTRPRFQAFGKNSFLLIVRGVNLNKGKDPDDMITIRMLFTPQRLITCNLQSSKAIEALIKQLHFNKGSENLASLIIDILNELNVRIEDFMESIESFIESCDQEQLTREQITDVNDMHKRLLKLNRFLKPEVHALADLSKAKLPAFEQHSIALAHQLDVVSRVIESIDFYIAQIDVINAKINQMNTELMNRNTYILSIIAGIFLPLGFLTGLFGINIGGMPGVEDGNAFYWFCGFLLIVGLFEYFLFRRLKFL